MNAAAAAALARREAADGRPEPPRGETVRSDLPGPLDHAGAEVDEFDAALVAGAGGVPSRRARKSELEREELESETELDEDEAADEGAPPAGPPGEPPRRRPAEDGEAKRPPAVVGSSSVRHRNAITPRQSRGWVPARQLGRAPARTVA